MNTSPRFIVDKQSRHFDINLRAVWGTFIVTGYVLSHLTLDASPIICSRRQFQILLCFFFKNNKYGMLFYENRLLSRNNIPYFC